MSAPDLLNIEKPPEWMADGLCAQVDPELWFPEKGGSTREAKAVCGRCEVRPECLAYALAHDDRFGVWGGVAERDRRRMTRAARARVPDRRTGLVRQLATRLTDPEIAARLGCSPRTVLRIRIAAGIPAARPTGNHRVGAA
ncbi:MAG: WhiB family transcriptional regulator [Actinobacteria bacterium]|nr:WhiB family transcriptional regulator [Actinomycetota bacterium]